MDAINDPQDQSEIFISPRRWHCSSRWHYRFYFTPGTWLKMSSMRPHDLNILHCFPFYDISNYPWMLINIESDSHFDGVIKFVFSLFLKHNVSLPSPCTGLKQEGKLRMRVEPGLFEWTKWVSGNSLPAWISPIGLAAANLSVDTTYKYRQTPLHCFILQYFYVYLCRCIFSYRHTVCIIRVLSEWNINHQKKYFYIFTDLIYLLQN